MTASTGKPRTKRPGLSDADDREHRNAAIEVALTRRKPVHTLAPCGAVNLTGCAGHRLAGGQRPC